MKNIILISSVLLFSVFYTSNVSAAEDRDFNISPEVYPVIELFGGWSDGFTFVDGPGIIAKRFASFGATEGPINDFAHSTDVGINFRYYISEYVDIGIGLFHQMSDERTGSYTFDYANVPLRDDDMHGQYFGPLYVTDTITYQTNNFDLKFRIGFSPLPNWLVSPYVTYGAGINYLRIWTEEEVTGDVNNDRLPQIIFEDEMDGKYTFDNAISGGFRFNVLPAVYTYIEGYYDFPFSNSLLYGAPEVNGRIDTTSFGGRFGVGFRFR